MVVTPIWPPLASLMHSGYTIQSLFSDQWVQFTDSHCSLDNGWMVYFKIRFPREKSETNKLLISCIVSSLFKNLEMRHMLNFVMKTLEFKVFLKNEETIYDINNLFVPPRFLAWNTYFEICMHLVIALFSMPSVVFTPLLCKAKIILLTNFFREPSSSRT